jgi:hypothetical protein
MTGFGRGGGGGGASTGRDELVDELDGEDDNLSWRALLGRTDGCGLTTGSGLGESHGMRTRFPFTVRQQRSTPVSIT